MLILLLLVAEKLATSGPYRWDVYIVILKLMFCYLFMYRRYGLVENKFCFEGGSSCGKGEGLYVLVTDQGENITRAFKMAAEGRLAVRRRPLARNMSG